MRTPIRVLTSSLLVWATACSGGAALTPADVVDLPPGTATGTAASGTYDLELYTVACRGQCMVRNGNLTGSACDVGEVDTAILAVTQRDGALDMDADGLIFERLEGGLDADGRFTVGGYATAQAGAVIAMVLADGALTAEGFTGTATQRAHGSASGLDFDCTAELELTGRRLR
jgi:hypothetical protein